MKNGEVPLLELLGSAGTASTSILPLQLCRAFGELQKLCGMRSGQVLTPLLLLLLLLVSPGPGACFLHGASSRSTVPVRCAKVHLAPPDTSIKSYEPGSVSLRAASCNTQTCLHNKQAIWGQPKSCCMLVCCPGRCTAEGFGSSLLLYAYYCRCCVDSMGG
jgi:hypothetical protein